MGDQNVVVEHQGQVAVATLNRPQRRNALSLELMLELIDCLDGIGRERSVRVVILAAAGRVFCSGHEVQKQSVAELSQTIAKGKNKMQAYDGKLTKDEIAQLAAYVKGLAKK